MRRLSQFSSYTRSERISWQDVILQYKCRNCVGTDKHYYLRGMRTSGQPGRPERLILYKAGEHPEFKIHVDEELVKKLGSHADLLRQAVRAEVYGLGLGAYGEWSVAQPLTAPVNTEANEIYSSVVADGSLYFTSDRSGVSELYRAQILEGASFAQPVHVGIAPPARGIGDTFVAPDESYLIFRGAEGFGGGDLYVAFREADGGWGEPVNLGLEINSDILDYCPMVTPDGRYLFFSRRRSEPPGGGWPRVAAGDVYWVDAAVIERLRSGVSDVEEHP